MRKTILATLSLALAGHALAAEGWHADIRYRHEAVDDDAFGRDAQADTLRLRLGWSGLLGNGFSAGAELEGVAELSDRFNSGANGHTSYPTVLDPESFELNRAWLAWQGEHLGATLGRQRLLLDNQRFVGNVGWRQNEQTFDALQLEYAPTTAFKLRYTWAARVHRVAGDEARDPLARERELDAHFLNAAWSGSAGTLVGYGYWLDDRDVATASSRTLGLRWTGQRDLGPGAFGWTLESARQHEHADNPRDFSLGYLLVEPSWRQAGLTWKLGLERLEGDGAVGFQTPLATLHAFNGWADKFGTTPANGLEDRYASVSGPLWDGKLGWTVAWHDFDADRGGADYGREWDASLSFPLPGKIKGLLKFADYRSDGFARDTRKLWLQLEWKFGAGV
jgi:hypothetical protein